MEAVPVTDSSSKMLYTLVLDVSNMADQAAKDADAARRRTSFEGALANMKVLAEGGELPAAPARGGGGGGGGGGRGGGRGQ